MLREEGVPLWTCPLANHHLGDTQGSTDPIHWRRKVPCPTLLGFNPTSHTNIRAR